MKSLFFAAFVGFGSAVAIAGCTVESGSGSDGGSEGTPDTGTVRLDLQGTSANGTQYRLRQASFTISTTPPTTLSSDANPAAATTLSQALAAGSYTVTLQPGWVLDRL